VDGLDIIFAPEIDDIEKELNKFDKFEGCDD